MPAQTMVQTSWNAPYVLKTIPKTPHMSISVPPPQSPYPATVVERMAYRTPEGKSLTPYQWTVYDYTLSIPRGRVATYKSISRAVGGSPRSVGNALRHNPFAPCVPCHRVIASDLFIGGFCGEWKKDHKTGENQPRKLKLLAQEGVVFNEKGRLLDVECVIKGA